MHIYHAPHTGYVKSCLLDEMVKHGQYMSMFANNVLLGSGVRVMFGLENKERSKALPKPLLAILDISRTVEMMSRIYGSLSNTEGIAPVTVIFCHLSFFC